MRLITLIFGCALAAAGPAAAATLANASFETGDLSSWNFTAGDAQVVTDADDAIVVPPLGQHYQATQGRWFAQLTAGPTAGTYSTLSQTFTLAGGGYVSFDAAFLAFDYLPYDDDAYVRVYNAATNAILFASSVAAVGDQGHTPWTRAASGLLGAGSYVFEAGVRNTIDPDTFYSSRLLLDNITIAALPPPPPPPPPGGVPEPATWTMMLLGFGAMGAMVRRRRRIACLR